MSTLTGSPAPTVGSGLDIDLATGDSTAARSAKTASSSSRSTTDPTTSAAISGGSSFTTGSCETPYSRRIDIAAPTVSSGCTWTSSGNAPPSSALRARTSPTLGSSEGGDKKP